MKKRSIAFIIGLMSFALLGVVIMQLYFLRQSYQLQSELFDRNVNEALNNVVAKVTRHDALNFLNVKNRQRQREQNALKNKALNDNGNLTDLSILSTKKRLTTREKKLAILRDSLRKLILNKKMDEEFTRLTQGGKFDLQFRFEEYTDELGITHQRITPQLVKTPVAGASARRKLHKYDTVRYIYSDPQFGKQVISVPLINAEWAREQDRKLKEKQLNEMRKLLENDSLENTPQNNTKTTVIANLAEEYGKYGEPLKFRLDPFWIDTLLRFELHNKGINLPFSYEVSLANKDSLIFSKANDVSGAKPVFDVNAYQTPIFSKDVINDPGLIKLVFPQRNVLLVNKMTASLATTGGLLLVLLLCFGYTIFSILKQKKVSEMKTDFINNMTHEFKTPVSTIMIASEALKDSEIAQDRKPGSTPC